MITDPDLHSFVASLSLRLRAVRSDVAEHSGVDARQVVDDLGQLGVLDLARDTADLPNALQWLSAVVRVCSSFSPSVGFALASQYAAQRVDGAADAAITACCVGAGGMGPRQATVPTLLAPDAVVMLERDGAGRIVLWHAVELEPFSDRTGLKQAELRTISSGATQDVSRELTADQTRAAVFEFDLLSASVALGLLDRTVAAAEEYAIERRQFGQPIARFTGLAAIVVGIRLKARTVESLVADTLDRGEDSGELAAVAGRAAVEACLDAIQVHGGYGYIDEYPVSTLLRDAVSLRARGGGRRSAVAAVAAARLVST